MIDVGSAIAKVRKKRGYTQDKLAQMLGCTKQTISNYERGERKPDIDMLEQIADVLHEPVTTFVRDIKHNVPDDGTQEEKPGGETGQDTQEHIDQRGDAKAFIAISGIANGKGVPEYIRIKFNDANIQMSYQGISGSFDSLYCQMSKKAKLSVISAMISHLKLTDMERLNLFSEIDVDSSAPELEENYDDEGEI